MASKFWTLRVGAAPSPYRPSYTAGSDVVWFAELRDRVTNALVSATDPTAVVYAADGTLIDPSPTPAAVSTGIYSIAIPDVTQAGTWRVSIGSSGDDVAGAVRPFTVTSDTPAPAEIGPTAVLSVNGVTGPNPVLGLADLDGSEAAIAEAASIAGAEAGAEAGEAAAAPAVTQAAASAAEALAASETATATVANAAVNRTTLAALQLVTGEEGQLGQVTAGADKGRYRYTSGVWTYEGRELVELETELDRVADTIYEAGLTSDDDAYALAYLFGSERVVGLGVDTYGTLVNLGMRVLPGNGRFALSRVVPIVSHMQDDGSAWCALWADPDGKIDLIPSDTLLRRLGGATTPPASLFDDVAAAVPLARAYSEDEGWPEHYHYRSDETTPAVAVAVSDDRAMLVGGGGQSNSVHGGQAAAVTTTPPYPHRGLMLTGGPVHSSQTAIDPATITGLVPARETTYECSVTARTRWMIARDIAAGIRPPVVIGETHGVGGRSLAEVSKGTDIYANGLMVWRQAVKWAGAYDLPGIWAPATVLDQGEEDRSDSPQTPLATWTALAATYQADVEADMRALTGQREPVWLVINQLAAPPFATNDAYTALAQFDAMMGNARTTIAMPAYFFQGAYGFDGVHFLAPGHALRGEYDAEAMRIVARATQAAAARGDDPFGLTIADIRTCLRPDLANITRSGAEIRIPLILPENGSAVVLDTSTLPAAVNYGFEKTAGAGGAISSVALDGNTIVVTLASAGGATLRYAYAAQAGDQTARSCAWGNFRDNCALESIAVPGLLLRNWLVVFQATVA